MNTHCHSMFYCESCTNANNKYVVLFETTVNATDVVKIINWHDQGWKGFRNESLHSMMITLHKAEVVEADNIDAYVKAFNEMSVDMQIIEYWEQK